MKNKTTQIGIIGYGMIGKAVHQMINDAPDNCLEVAFIYDIERENLKDIEEDLVLGDLADFPKKNPDLIIEMAHPDVTREWGTRILKNCDYMFVSVTVLADQGMINKLEEATHGNGTRAFIPHGGLIGMDAIFENRNIWDSVSIIMKKPVDNIDYTEVDINPKEIKKKTVLYDGPTRGVCPLFPRNVNTHAAIAYAGIGFDKTNSLLVVDPKWDKATVAVHAKAEGVEINIERIEAISGVTGATTPNSIYNSLQMAVSNSPGIHLR